jgi:hypothetical protein
MKAAKWVTSIPDNILKVDLFKQILIKLLHSRDGFGNYALTHSIVEPILNRKTASSTTFCSTKSMKALSLVHDTSFLIRGPGLHVWHYYLNQPQPYSTWWGNHHHYENLDVFESNLCPTEQDPHRPGQVSLDIFEFFGITLKSLKYYAASRSALDHAECLLQQGDPLQLSLARIKVRIAYFNNEEEEEEEDEEELQK